MVLNKNKQQLKMPQRICSRKTPLLKTNTKRISKKNHKLSLNGSNNTKSSLKQSIPSNFTKVKHSESIDGKWEDPRKKMRNTGSGRFKATQNLKRHDVDATQMSDNDASGNCYGKKINFCYFL